MSSLLEQAVIDAKALKEAALKNAEAAIINKYSQEVKSTLDRLLEQEEELGGLGDLGLGVPPEDPAAEAGLASGKEQKDLFSEDSEDVTLAGTDGLDKNDSRLNEEDDLVEVTIDLDTLKEAIEKLENQLDEEEEFDLSSLLSEKDGGEKDGGEEGEEDGDEKEGKEEEERENLDELLNSIVEKLTVDAGADLSGWAGMRKEEKAYQLERELASRRSSEFQEELENMKTVQEELMLENKKLKTKINNLTGVLEKAKDNLHEVNLSNARLLYTNRVLRDTSLNERQKNRIVEAISKAGSVKDAKTIYESLQSTVESTPIRRPKSLSEAIERPSHLIRGSRQTSENVADPLQDRWKKLAGLN